MTSARILFTVIVRAVAVHATTFLLIVQFISCTKNTGSPGGGMDKSKMKFPVELAPVRLQSVNYRVFAVGSIEPFEIVQVTARVAGVVDQVRFTEGKNASIGQVLVEIEPERYRIAVQSAKAVLEKAEAAKADAEAGLTRRESVIDKNPGLIPGEEIETWKTKVRATASDVLQARAALEQAELNLRDAFVKAPVQGTIQTRTVQTGLYVQPGTVLATLIRRDPLLLRFKVPEQDATRILPGMSAYFTVASDDHSYLAIIRHVTATADQTTRMVTITAEVTDPNKAKLRPGSFAEIRVPVGSAREMPVIPQTAIRPSERGFLAYTVENETAREQILTLGLRTEDGLVEVLSGLKEGQQLVIRGSEALKDGAKVRTGGKEAALSAGSNPSKDAQSR